MPHASCPNIMFTVSVSPLLVFDCLLTIETQHVVSDSDSLVRCNEGCQFFARQKYVPSHQLQTILITWPFLTWGLDLLRPFNKAKCGFTHIFIAVDKFTKWIKVKPASSITTAKAV
jgi:hypothetical protein